MGDNRYQRHVDHERHDHDPVFAAAEVLAMSMLFAADRVATAIEGLTSSEQPEWAKRLEQQMGAVQDAIDRVEANLTGLSDEVGQIIDVLNELQNREDPAAAVAELNSVADRLGTVKESLESATTLDDPPVEEPTDPGAPADPGTPDEPAPGVPNDGGVIDQPAPDPSDPTSGTDQPGVPNDGGVIEAPPSDGGDAGGTTDGSGGSAGDQPPA